MKANPLVEKIFEQMHKDVAKRIAGGFELGYDPKDKKPTKRYYGFNTKLIAAFRATFGSEPFSKKAAIEFTARNHFHKLEGLSIDLCMAVKNEKCSLQRVGRALYQFL